MKQDRKSNTAKAPSLGALAQAQAIVEEIERIHDQTDRYTVDVMNQEWAVFDKLDALSRRLGPGLKPGRVIYWPVGDGRAFYLVVKISPAMVQLRHIPVGDGYHSPAVTSRGLALRETVEQAMKSQDGLEKIFGRSDRSEKEA